MCPILIFIHDARQAYTGTGYDAAVPIGEHPLSVRRIALCAKALISSPIDWPPLAWPIVRHSANASINWEIDS